MSTHNICSRGKNKKRYQQVLVKKKHLILTYVVRATLYQIDNGPGKAHSDEALWKEQSRKVSVNNLARNSEELQIYKF